MIIIFLSQSHYKLKVAWTIIIKKSHDTADGGRADLLGEICYHLTYADHLLNKQVSNVPSTVQPPNALKHPPPF